MAKTKISEFDTNADNNTDINNINIAEGCAPSGINNAIRQLMADLKEWQSGAGDYYIAPAGTASTPAITTTGDTNTGIFFPAADTIAFTEGGVESMRIDSSGNVGIGTTSTSAKLTVNNETDTTAYNDSATDGQLTAGATQLIRAGAGANTNVAQLVFQTRATQPFNRIVSSGGTSPFMAFGTNNAERMRITSDGEVLVSGTTVMPEPYSGGGAPKLTVEHGSGAYLALFRNDTTVISGNPIGDISFYGNDTTSNTPTRLAYVAALASGSHAASDNPTDLVFGTTDDGTATVSEIMRLGGGGTVPYLRMASGSGGIQFNGDTAAANALDDYEEGTFTPTIIGTTTAGTGTYSVQNGSYTKIGNSVRFNLTLTWSAHTGTGNMRVAGLPFTSASTAPVSFQINNIALTAGNYFMAYFEAGTEIILNQSPTGGGAASAIPMDTAGSIRLAGIYNV